MRLGISLHLSGNIDVSPPPAPAPSGPVEMNADADMSDDGLWTKNGWVFSAGAATSSPSGGTLTRTSAEPLTAGNYDYEIVVDANPDQANISFVAGGDTVRTVFYSINQGGGHVGTFTGTVALTPTDNLLQVVEGDGYGNIVVSRFSLVRQG